ncbi:MAG: integrin alpha, partial [bacterium]
LTLDTPTPDRSAGFGEVVAGLGDVDGDGAPDFLVGAPGHDVGGNSAQGRAFVVLSVALRLARTQVPCTIAGCRARARCDLSPAFGSACTNRIDLRVRVPRRLAEDGAGKGHRRLRLFARSNATSVPPSQTANVPLRLTRLGRRIVRTSTANKLRGVIEIRNAPGTAIDATRVRIRLRRR